MENTTTPPITISATVAAPIEQVWHFWNDPQAIIQWNAASDDWHTPSAENDLRVGGTLQSRMEAKDGSWGFDFKGTYTAIQEHTHIEYVLDDGRKVQVTFKPEDNNTIVTETFDAEDTMPREFQEAGWQAILNNFKKYAEAQQN
ncbi:SRPBCC family protein [Adhaeribacter aquaticus]|uniref:SRPBCC family protein n=1 Tax=Adhaeribacter aquaticus TaxID=299567 RepID=UPI0004286551|nr:SRPBCC family protein [Adhaeribacter aquaticus]